MTFEQWQRHVLIAEGLKDWRVEFSSAGGYCWFKDKLIQINPNSDAPVAGFLHELAHALHPEREGEYKNHYHGGGWADTFGRLVTKYMTTRQPLTRGQ